VTRPAPSGPAREGVDSISWWHTLEFPNGVVTPGVKNANVLALEAELVFRHPVRGQTVLDIGTWNGFFSFEAARRGAERVLALENFACHAPEHRARDAFELARRHLNPDIEMAEMDVMAIAPENVGVFDVVLFLGVLYHLKHPLLALERVAAVCREHLVLETHLGARDSTKPMMAFYPGSELDGDATNWWGPNKACVEEMLRTVGFKTIEHSPHPTSLDHRGIFHAWK
jgi:tRNA (mo5U34)-methyltransferase